MSTMKFITSLTLTLISTVSFASGGGGGVLAAAMSAKLGSTQEIIFNMGQKDGLVQFAYGQLVDKKWQVQKLEMPETELMADASVMKALQDSKDLKSWAEIK